MEKYDSICFIILQIFTYFIYFIDKIYQDLPTISSFYEFIFYYLFVKPENLSVRKKTSCFSRKNDDNDELVNG